MIDFHHFQRRKGARRHAVERVRQIARHGKRLTRQRARDINIHQNFGEHSC